MSTNKNGFEHDDIKWLEERMGKESEEIEIPKALEPDQMLEKVKGMEQKHSNNRRRKTAVMAVSLVLVVGASLQTGRMMERASQKSFVEDRGVVAVVADLPEKEKNHDNKGHKESVVNNHKEKVDKKLEDVDKKTIPVSELRGFKEGDGKGAVTDGSMIYSGAGKNIIFSKYDSDQVQEVKRLEVEQETKDFYLFPEHLVCIMSDEKNGTTVSVFDVSSLDEPKMAFTKSIEGNYQCSYQNGDNLYVFTDTGRLNYINVGSNQTSTFSLEESGAKYYMSDNMIYALKQSDQGTEIQSYKLEEGTLEKGEEVTSNVLLDNIVAVQGAGQSIELLAAESDGIRLIQYDEHMRFLYDKKNKLGEQIFAGEFTENGILIFGNDTFNIHLSMLESGTLETKDRVSIESAQSVSIGELSLKEDGSKVGFLSSSADLQDSAYCVYDYSENGGFAERNTKQVKVGKVENELVIGSSVLLADSSGGEVIVD
ncbi:beta-propeller domain-containing protein [[Clostridium] polysaccharolyticum]|uniref:Beta propeller domain-containing protein n=1 Tax=[Clostridium] polysaccharolyticum TaxID=29364 RepID=A0A1I0EYI7_9FIRM|nr:beta-propeller domain-containing protein [[Clostridium] polysaccharolyticum]SET50718.1 Beta propeller domain-containing protein [[Clostridium] polysaccharolyticum]